MSDVPFFLRIRKDKVVQTINIAAIFGSLNALAIVLVAILTSEVSMGDIVFIFFILLLSLGVYMKNRVSVVVLLGVSSINIIVTFIFSQNDSLSLALSRLIGSLLLFIVLLRGTRAVFIWHKHLKKGNYLKG